MADLGENCPCKILPCKFANCPTRTLFFNIWGGGVTPPPPHPPTVTPLHIPRASVNNRGNPADCVASSCLTLPYVKGVTEKVSRVLRRENIKVRYKPTTTLSQQFTKPKDKSPPEQTNGVVYKICCYDCDFVYYGQTDRALKTRIKEHERAVSHFDQYSKIAKHAEQYDHRIDFNNASIVNKTKKLS